MTDQTESRAGAANRDHERIWLEPRSHDGRYGHDGRQWCQDKVWPFSEGEPEPTEYIRADLVSALPGSGGVLTEEAVARALTEFQFGSDAGQDSVESHIPMARAVLALLHPAIEAARREERGAFPAGYRAALKDAAVAARPKSQAGPNDHDAFRIYERGRNDAAKDIAALPVKDG